ncbi:hypothetical protein KSP40_PGU009467 [Platanthera guangdongensis]|uniref:Uncharacterized protein n=1 Tax=Platanthera guangdongensis TaxID=2320717 RepID=A0ABR2LE39_9ASPA
MQGLEGGGVRSRSAGVGFPGALESSEASGLSLLRWFLALPRPQSIRHLPPSFMQGHRHFSRPQILGAGSDLRIPDSYLVFRDQICGWMNWLLKGEVFCQKSPMVKKKIIPFEFGSLFLSRIN